MCWSGKVSDAGDTRDTGDGRVCRPSPLPFPEPPTVRVSASEAHDGILTLRCRAFGFYPRPIGVSWLKDGEVRDQDTEWGGIVPNSDSTYYTWAAIEARPEDRDRYQCRVDHASLPKPQLFASGESRGRGGRGAGWVRFPSSHPCPPQSRSPAWSPSWWPWPPPSWLSSPWSPESPSGGTAQVKRGRRGRGRPGTR